MGFAIGYALSRGTLLVSALLGVFVYREFNGADAKTWAVQIAALYLFFAAILLEAMAKCLVCCEYTRWLFIHGCGFGAFYLNRRIQNNDNLSI